MCSYFVFTIGILTIVCNVVDCCCRCIWSFVNKIRNPFIAIIAIISVFDDVLFIQNPKLKGFNNVFHDVSVATTV